MLVDDEQKGCWARGKNLALELKLVLEEVL